MAVPREHVAMYVHVSSRAPSSCDGHVEACDLASAPWHPPLTPMIFSGPELALRAQLLGWAAHAPAPSHLRPLLAPKQRLAGRREGTEETALREELQQREGRSSWEASRLQTKLQPRHMGWQMSVPLQGGRRCGLLTVRGARVRIQPLGCLEFDMRRC